MPAGNLLYYALVALVISLIAAFLGFGGAMIDIHSSNAALAARGGFGADLGDAIFFEVAGLLTDKVDGATADSVGFYLGYRF